jgi:hypothetical protein
MAMVGNGEGENNAEHIPSHKEMIVITERASRLLNGTMEESEACKGLSGSRLAIMQHIVYFANEPDL